MLRQKTLKALFVALVLSAVVVGTTLAEQYRTTRTVSGVTGTTWHSTTDAKWKAKTTATSVAPWLYVNERSWGNGGKKDEQQSAGYNSTSSGTVGIWDGYAQYGASYMSQHSANTQYGGFTFYTSDNACFASYCWWAYGFSGVCARTC
jgi:hypothetical protein